MPSVTGAHVTVQAETARTDVWVPEGLAVRKHPYPPTGYSYAYDARTLAMQDKREQNNRGFSFGPFVPLTDGEWSTLSPVSWSVEYPNSVGPCITSMREPVPVAPGMEVSFSGIFRVRPSGQAFNSPWSDDESNEPIDVLVTLWGLGTATDEYGQESENQVVLARHRARLQNSGSTSLTEVEFTLGDPTDLVWRTVPDNVDRAFLSIDLLDGEQGPPLAGFPWEPHYVSADYRITAIANKVIFRCPRTDAVTMNPIRVHVRDPHNAHPTYPNPLSATGCAFRNRTRFDNITPGVEVTALATPDATTPVDVAVYAWTGTRGPLLATLTVPVGEKSTVTVDYTGSIELAGTGNYDIESVLAPVYETDTIEQTRTTRYEYTDVLDPVSSVKTTLREADLPVANIRFVSDVIAAEVPAGHRVRICGRTPAGLVPIFTGFVRTRRLVSTPRRNQQVEIGVHGQWSTLNGDYPYMFDQLAEYGPVLHATGVPTLIDDVDYSGVSAALPTWPTLNPSYTAASSLLDGLLATRNSRLAYLFMDRRGQLVFTSSLPDEIALEVTDQPDSEAPSYSRDLEVSTDSTSLVNTLEIQERVLDWEHYVDRRYLQGGDSPQAHQSAPLTSKRRSISYREADSVDAYGKSSQTLNIVRGTGVPRELLDDDRYGPTYKDRADFILGCYAHERNEFTKLTIPVLRPDDIARIAALQPLDAVAIRHGGTTQVIRPRVVEHTISPSGWLCELDASVRRDQVYWLPDPPDVSDPPVVGGHYNNPGAGTIDGGTPESPGTGTIDGGEL